jgi:hypothetical protein
MSRGLSVLLGETHEKSLMPPSFEGLVVLCNQSEQVKYASIHIQKVIPQTAECGFHKIPL